MFIDVNYFKSKLHIFISCYFIKTKLSLTYQGKREEAKLTNFLSSFISTISYNR